MFRRDKGPGGLEEPTPRLFLGPSMYRVEVSGGSLSGWGVVVGQKGVGSFSGTRKV